MQSDETLDPGLTELIDQQLRPNVVRIDTEGFYPEAFLRRLGAIVGYKHHALATENMPLAIHTMSQAGRFCGSTAFLIWCHDACVSESFRVPSTTSEPPIGLYLIPIVTSLTGRIS